MNKTLSGCLQELKNKGKVQLGVPKVVTVTYGSGRLWEFKSRFKPGFKKVAVTRAGRLHEWTCEIFHYFLQPWVSLCDMRVSPFPSISIQLKSIVLISQFCNFTILSTLAHGQGLQPMKNGVYIEWIINQVPLILKYIDAVSIYRFKFNTTHFILILQFF